MKKALRIKGYGQRNLSGVRPHALFAAPRCGEMFTNFYEFCLICVVYCRNDKENKRGLLYERKVCTIYVRQIRNG